MRFNFNTQVVCCLVFLVLLNACAPINTPPPTAVPPTATAEPLPLLTITFRNGTCEYEGPASIESFKARLKIVDQEEDSMVAGGTTVSIITLEEGKSLEDLKSWPEHYNPQWATIFATKGLDENELVGEFDVYLPEETIYISCFDDDVKVGVQGPVYWGDEGS